MPMTDAATATLDSYIQSHIAAYMRDHDELTQFPWPLWDDLTGDLEIFSPFLSQAGQVLSPDFIASVRQIANEFPALATILLTQGCYGLYPLIKYGSRQQQELYLQQLVKGRLISGLGFSEYKHLEKLDQMETRAIRTEAGWTLNGKKAMVSNSSVAGLLFVLAKVEEAGQAPAFGFFLVDTRDPAVQVGEQIENQGLIGLPLSSVTLDQVQLPADALLGDALEGDSQFKDIINQMQLGLSAIALGIAEGAFNKGIEFARIKRGFGRRLIDVEVHQDKFADLYNKLCSAEAYFASFPNQIEEDAKFVSRIKLYTSKVALEISEEIIRLMGPLQKFDRVNIRRYLRDAETIENYGRSGNSIRREIAQRWLKE